MGKKEWENLVPPETPAFQPPLMRAHLQEAVGYKIIGCLGGRDNEWKLAEFCVTK
jgi:hypothetical protein